MAKLANDGKIALICHIGLMVPNADPPLFRRCLHMLLFSSNLLFHSPAIYHDPMGTIPLLPGRFLIHDTALCLKIIIHGSSILDAMRRGKHGIELSCREKFPVKGSDPVIPAICFHALKGEMVFQKEINKPVFILDLLIIEREGFMRL